MSSWEAKVREGRVCVGVTIERARPAPVEGNEFVGGERDPGLRKGMARRNRAGTRRGTRRGKEKGVCAGGLQLRGRGGHDSGIETQDAGTHA